MSDGINLEYARKNSFRKIPDDGNARKSVLVVTSVLDEGKNMLINKETQNELAEEIQNKLKALGQATKGVVLSAAAIEKNHRELFDIYTLFVKYVANGIILDEVKTKNYATTEG